MHISGEKNAIPNRDKPETAAAGVRPHPDAFPSASRRVVSALGACRARIPLGCTRTFHAQSNLMKYSSHGDAGMS